MNALLISLAIFFYSVNVESFTNEIKPLAFNGQVSVNSKPCEGASISICRLSGEEGDCQTDVYQMATEKNGKFDFQLEPDAHYKLEIKKNGFIDRYVLFDTRMPTDRTGNLKPFLFVVELSKGADAKEPLLIASIYFDVTKNQLDYRLDPK